MRMSVIRSDPGYDNRMFGAVVTVDGVEQPQCFTADEERGEAWCYALAKPGQRVLNYRRGAPAVECHRGKVVITVPESNEDAA